ncbi:MAG TPA: hypothetical protein VG347_23415, partial [Verrucomicrobiae bacterium]|nr:hypothetical protein [Verrucomicrobiae bacterium]
MEKIEIVLRDNGTLTERTIRERDLRAEGEVLDALTADVTRQQRNVMTIPDWGLAHANVGLSDTIWSVPIDRLPLKARFRLINGVLVPMFASTTDLEMPLVWRPPTEVKLVFVVRTELMGDLTAVQGNWLFALNADKNGYRLPLPNLHDECTICTGEFETGYDTDQAAIIASLKQFDQSKWNSDLMRTVAQSQKFFRFQPTNETFTTLPIDSKEWTGLCDKVSSA